MADCWCSMSAKSLQSPRKRRMQHCTFQILRSSVVATWHCKSTAIQQCDSPAIKLQLWMVLICFDPPISVEVEDGFWHRKPHISWFKSRKKMHQLKRMFGATRLHWKCQAEERFRCQADLRASWSFMSLPLLRILHMDRIVWSFSLHWKLLWKYVILSEPNKSLPFLHCDLRSRLQRCFLLFSFQSRPVMIMPCCGRHVWWKSQAHLCAGSLVASEMGETPKLPACFSQKWWENYI